MDDQHTMYPSATAAASISSSNGHCSNHPYSEAHHAGYSSFSVIPNQYHHHVNQEPYWPHSSLSHHQAFANCSLQAFTPDSLDGNNNNNDETFQNHYSNNVLPGEDMRQHCMKWPASCASTPDKTPNAESFFEHAFQNCHSIPTPEDMDAFTQRLQNPGYDCPSIGMPYHQIKREPDQDQCHDLLAEDYSSTSSSIGTMTGSVPEFYTGKFSLLDHSLNSPSSPHAPEDDERRRKRRERNKVAATKCRHKKKEHVFRLNMESEKLESSNITLKAKLAALEAERNHLIDLMNAHQPFCLRMSGSSDSSASAFISVQHHHHHHQNHSHESQIHHS